MTKATTSPLGNALKTRRLYLGLSMRAAAARCGITTSTYANLEARGELSQWSTVCRAIEGLGGRVDYATTFYGEHYEDPR